MLGRTNTGGGGGASLNFKVVGNPQPETAKDNTIWVDTDVKITGWVFSATEPETPAEGMVWITTGTSSGVAFNALKKNNITVYPIAAKQYVNGAWVDKSAKSYQGGKWVEWVTWLYKDGDQCVDITGGWAMRETSHIAKPTAPTVGENGIKISFNYTSYQTCCYAGPENDIKIPDGANRLCAEITSITASKAYLGIVIGSDLKSPVALARSNSVGKLSLDVSSLGGETHPIAIGSSTYTAMGLSDDTNCSIDATVSRVWFE